MGSVQGHPPEPARGDASRILFREVQRAGSNGRGRERVGHLRRVVGGPVRASTRRKNLHPSFRANGESWKHRHLRVVLRYEERAHSPLSSKRCKTRLCKDW
jgi:hypothetical protein